MNDIKVGLQLIVYGQRQKEDLEGVLREVAEAGYAGVEAGGEFFNILGKQRTLGLLAELNLTYTGTHIGYGSLAEDGYVQQAIEHLHEIGGQYLICSGVADTESLDGYRQTCPVFNAVGAQCRAAGLTFCYHNHAWEFTELDGVKGIHYLGENTDPQIVKFNIDVYWVAIGGEDPAEFITRYADRAGYYHFKDGSPGEFIELGQGTVDLVGAKDAALRAGIDWIVCEQDTTKLEPKVSIAQSREYLRSIGL